MSNEHLSDLAYTPGKCETCRGSGWITGPVYGTYAACPHGCKSTVQFRHPDPLRDACRYGLKMAEAWMRDAAPTPEDAVPTNMEWAAANKAMEVFRDALGKATP